MIFLLCLICVSKVPSPTAAYEVGTKLLKTEDNKNAGRIIDENRRVMLWSILMSFWLFDALFIAFISEDRLLLRNMLAGMKAAVWTTITARSTIVICRLNIVRYCDRRIICTVDVIRIG